MRNAYKEINFKLYLVTDRKLVTPHASLITAVKEALKGGVKAIQLREKDLGTRELLNLAYKMRELTRKYKARLFINDRVDVALAVNADGIHLPQNSVPIEAVRNAVHGSRVTGHGLRVTGYGSRVTGHGSRFLIGVSTHSLREAREAERERADFITLGPVYRTPSKLRYGSPVGLETLKEVCKGVNIPVFAIGGIKAGRIRQVMGTGAYGVAMISGIFGSEDIKSKTNEIMNIIEGR